MKSAEIRKNEILSRDMLEERLKTLTGYEGLNIKDDEYCYIRLVGNHLEIGRAKIILEE